MENLETIKEIPASIDGTVKATSFTLVDSQEQEQPVRILFVAVRGSSSLIDWLVNADGDAVDAGNFLVLSPPSPP
jgi:hypothetical protein